VTREIRVKEYEAGMESDTHEIRIKEHETDIVRGTHEVNEEGGKLLVA
jgi:hypothetical protein